MGYLIAESFNKSYFVHKCTASFLFLFIFYSSIFIGPFFLAKQSGDYWSLNNTYYEQPHVNFRGSYILSCYHGTTQKMYTNIDPLNQQNDNDFRPSFSVFKNDTNLDSKYDYFSVVLGIQLDETENSEDLKQCQVYLMADYGLRDEVRLQMISPLHFKLGSNSGIRKAFVQGSIELFQKNPLLSQSVLRSLYNQVYNQDNIQENTLEGFLTEYISRNESLYSNYNTYIVPGTQQLGEKIEIKIDLQDSNQITKLPTPLSEGNNENMTFRNKDITNQNSLDKISDNNFIRSPEEYSRFCQSPQKGFEQIIYKNLGSDKEIQLDQDGNIQSQKLNQMNQTKLSFEYSLSSKSQINNNSNFLNQNTPSKRQKKTRKQENLWTFIQTVTILRMVKNFIKTLKTYYLDKNALRSLTKTQINRIGDVTFEYTDPALIKKQLKKERQQQLLYYRIYQKVTTFFPIIQPNQAFKLLTDCWQSFLVLYRMFFTSVKLFFFITDIRASIDLVDTTTLMIINFSFIFDMFLSLHTGYYEKGVIVTDRYKIAKRYLTTTFISDVIAQIPLFFAYQVTSDSDYTLCVISYVLEFLIFLKLFSLSTVFHRLERVLTENEIASNWWPLVRLILIVTILAHIVALLYFGSALIQIEWWGEEKTWYQDREYSDRSWLDAYLHAIYWAFQTMVSNQLYEPTTRSDALFSVVAIMGLTGIFAYILNTIGMILEKLEKNSKKFKSEREITNRFLKKRQIPPSIRERVALYLDYVHEQEKDRNKEEEDQVLNRLSVQLRDEILMYINKKNIEKFSMIHNNFSQDLKQQLMLVMREDLYSPGEIIYTKGQRENYDKDTNTKDQYKVSMYMVLKGSVDLYEVNKHNQKQFVIKTVQEGEIFGNYEFFTGLPRLENARSSESCTVIRIDREKFIEIVEQLPEDYEKYCMIKDDLIQFKESVYSDIKCQLCQHKGHFPQDCPTVNLKINKTNLIFEYTNFDLHLTRRPYERLDDKWHHALNDMEEIQLGIEELVQRQDETTEALLKLAEDIEQKQKSYQNTNVLGQSNPGNAFTNSSQYQSQDYGVSLEKINEEEEYNRDIDKSIKSPFEFQRRQSTLTKARRRTSVINKFAQASNQISEDQQNSNLNLERKNSRQSKRVQNIQKKRASIMATQDDLLASTNPSNIIFQQIQGLNSTDNEYENSQKQRSTQKMKQQIQKQIQGLQGKSPSLVMPIISQNPYQIREEKEKLKEIEKQNEIDNSQMIYIFQNFDKMKNWDVYQPRNNFIRIKFQKGISKFFTQMNQRIHSENSDSSSKKQFFHRRQTQMDPTKMLKHRASQQKSNGDKSSFLGDKSISHQRKIKEHSNIQRSSNKDFDQSTPMKRKRGISQNQILNASGDNINNSFSKEHKKQMNGYKNNSPSSESSKNFEKKQSQFNQNKKEKNNSGDNNLQILLNYNQQSDTNRNPKSGGSNENNNIENIQQHLQITQNNNSPSQ